MEEATGALLGLSLKLGHGGCIESPRAMLESPNSPRSRGATASVHSVPPEITAMIFGFLRGMLPPSESNKLPIQLAHVSQHWRNIAFGAASFLWTDIDFSPPWIPEKISMYLESSGSYPFILDCLWPAKVDIGSPEAKQAFSLLSAHLARCRSFTVRGYLNHDLLYSTTVAIMELLSERELPLLEFFSLERVNPTNYSMNFLAPALSDMRLGRLCTLSPNFHFGALTTLHIGNDMEYDEFFQILKSSHRLVTLAVYDDLIQGWPEFDAVKGSAVYAPPVVLRDLRSIQIYGNMRSVSELLWSISAPSLNDLVIAPVVANDLTVLGDFCDGKAPIFPSLTTLTLAPAHGYAFEALPIAYKCFPSVEHLAFANIYVDPFRRYFCDCGDDFLWPNLKTFALRGVGPYVARLVEKMVALREEWGYPLEKLYFDDTSNFQVVGSLKVTVEKRDVWGLYQIDAFYQDEEERFLGIDERHVQRRRGVLGLLADDFSDHPHSHDAS